MSSRTIGGIALAAVALLAACGTSKPAEESVSATIGACAVSAGPMSFLIGNRSNSPAIGSNPPDPLATATRLAADNGSDTMLADTGGMPQVLTLSPSADPGAPTPVDDQTPEQRLANLKLSIRSTEASAREANPLEALTLAADHIHSHGGSGTIVMVDSGLQTTGVLDYTDESLLRVPGEQLAARLTRAGALPDLTGVTMVFVGLGSTSAPQKALDTPSREALKAQWRAIARAAGATCVTDETTAPTGAATGDLPTVSVVEVPSDPATPAAT